MKLNTRIHLNLRFHKTILKWAKGILEQIARKVIKNDECIKTKAKIDEVSY